MGDSSTKRPFNLYSSVFISFMIHFLIFNCIILTFTPHKISTKPFFIFLGSILQKDDLLTETPMMKSTSQSNIPGVDTTTLVKQPSYNTRAKQPIDKPIFSSNVPKSNKVDNKFLFYEKGSEPPKAERKEEKILGIDINLPERVPLKMNIK